MPNNVTIIATGNPYTRNVYHTRNIVRASTAEHANVQNVQNVQNLVGSVGLVDYPIATTEYTPMSLSALSVLPFRVSFETVGLRPYGPGNVPPIGIAVVGFNNYIL